MERGVADYWVCEYCGSMNADGRLKCPNCGAIRRQKVNTQKPKMCPVCKGMGHIQEQTKTIFGVTMTIKTCPKCQGRNTVIRCSEE